MVQNAFTSAKESAGSKEVRVIFTLTQTLERWSGLSPSPLCRSDAPRAFFKFNLLTSILASHWPDISSVVGFVLSFSSCTIIAEIAANRQNRRWNFLRIIYLWRCVHWFDTAVVRFPCFEWLYSDLYMSNIWAEHCWLGKTRFAPCEIDLSAMKGMYNLRWSVHLATTTSPISTCLP